MITTESDTPTPRQIVDALVAKFYEPPPMTSPPSPFEIGTQSELLPLGEFLTKRERFAMAAMQSLILVHTNRENIAGMAVLQADTMIEALKSTPQPA